MFNLISMWWRQEKSSLLVALLVLGLNTLIPWFVGNGKYGYGFLAIVLMLDAMLAVSIWQDFRRANRGKQDDDYGE